MSVSFCCSKTLWSFFMREETLSTHIMSFNEAEMKSLRKDIMRLKDKIALDKELVSFSGVPQTTDNEDENKNPTDEIIYRMKLNPSRENFKLTSVNLFDDSGKENETKLVYVNNDMNNDLEENIRLQVDEEFGSDDEEEFENTDRMLDYMNGSEQDSFKEFIRSIKIDELLRPITRPSDVVNIKPVSQIYKARFLEKLSNDTIDLIESEQKMVNLLNKTMDIFLNADPEHIAADNFGLPEYDHNLDIEKLQQNGNQASTIVNESGDPFFKPPKYESDPKFDNIKPEEIDETRHLLQIALQRNEEYIRSLMQIRQGFLHADKYREEIYKWCEEMNEIEMNQN